MYNEYPDISANPEIAAVLKETVNLLVESFAASVGKAANRGALKVQRRQIYMLFYIAQHPKDRIERTEIAQEMNVSVATVDQDLKKCRKLLRETCAARDLPPKAFENLILNL